MTVIVCARARHMRCKKRTTAVLSAIANLMSAFDPVACLPGDLAAICLSFLDFRTLLGAAQFVSHAWRDAIDGGLPAVWHKLCVDGYLKDEKLAGIIQKSRGRIQEFHMHCFSSTRGCVYLIRMLSNLRSLHIAARHILLSPLPLLEDLSIDGRDHCDTDVVLPVMPSLKTVCVKWCKSVNGLHNLPVLSSLYVESSKIAAEEPWPASLREITIYSHHCVNPRVLERIASLQQLTKLVTDWSFCNNYRRSMLTPPYDQLSFLSTLKSFQHLAVTFTRNIPFSALSNHFAAMASIRQLSFQFATITDEDLRSTCRISTLQVLKFRNLESPSIITSQGLQHLSSLPSLTKLTLHTYDSGSSITDYAAVGSCTQLRSLRIDGRFHHLSLNEIQVISSLPHLEKLRLCVRIDPDHFKVLCTVRSLRELNMHMVNVDMKHIHVRYLSALPSLSALETLIMHYVIDASKLVDYMVQMPTLRHIRTPAQLCAEDEARLREALPRLETLRVVG